MLTDSHRRLILGILCLFMAAVAVWLNWLDPELGDKHLQFQSGSLRMTAVLAMLWLALPEIQRGPRTVIFLFVTLCVVAVVFRNGLKIAVPAISILLVLGYLRKLTAVFSGGRPLDRRR
jgi:hypothetical protein